MLHKALLEKFVFKKDYQLRKKLEDGSGLVAMGVVENVSQGMADVLFAAPEFARKGRMVICICA